MAGWYLFIKVNLKNNVLVRPTTFRKIGGRGKERFLYKQLRRDGRREVGVIIVRLTLTSTPLGREPRAVTAVSEQIGYVLS